MTWNNKADEEQSARFLEILDQAIEAGTAAGIPEAKEDDRNGRVTGKWECSICGMRYNEHKSATDCCFPHFIAAGIDPFGQSAQKCGPDRDYPKTDFKVDIGPGPR